MPSEQHLRQFLLFVFALIVPFFALWTLTAAAVAMPLVGLADLILGAWFPDVIQGLYTQGSDALMMTRYGEENGTVFPVGDDDEALGFLINPGVLTYSLPFYATLHFATQKQEYLADFLVGIMLLLPCLLIGLLSVCIKDLRLNLGDVFANQPDAWVPPDTFIALSYQFCALILPTLAPMLIWAWQNRETALLRPLQTLVTTPR